MIRNLVHTLVVEGAESERLIQLIEGAVGALIYGFVALVFLVVLFVITMWWIDYKR